MIIRSEQAEGLTLEMVVVVVVKISCGGSDTTLLLRNLAALASFSLSVKGPTNLTAQYANAIDNAEKMTNVRIMFTQLRVCFNYCRNGTKHFVPFVLLSHARLSEHTGLIISIVQQRCNGEYVASTTLRTRALT